MGVGSLEHKPGRSATKTTADLKLYAQLGRWGEPAEVEVASPMVGGQRGTGGSRLRWGHSSPGRARSCGDGSNQGAVGT